jgi:putative transposase
MIMATRKRHSPEQVVRKLTTADRLLAEGKDVAAVCRELGVRADVSPVAQPARGGEGGVEGGRQGKFLSLDRRRAAVHHLMRAMGLSERFAFRVTGQHRGTQRRVPVATVNGHRDLRGGGLRLSGLAARK